MKRLLKIENGAVVKHLPLTREDTYVGEIPTKEVSQTIRNYDDQGENPVDTVVKTPVPDYEAATLAPGWVLAEVELPTYRGKRIPLNDLMEHLTVSFGIATYPADVGATVAKDRKVRLLESDVKKAEYDAADFESRRKELIALGRSSGAASAVVDRDRALADADKHQAALDLATTSGE